MNLVLLSGGSGQRLWPLSNDIRSKQFIKIFHREDGELESMVQRVYRFDLPINPLHHGFIGAVGLFEKLDKLLGADVVGQGPQPLARPAG